MVHRADRDREPDPQDPAPAEVVAAAKAAFTSRSPGNLAVLVHDSLVDEGHLPGRHTLRFEHDGTDIEVEVSATPAQTSLRGSITPPRGGRVMLMMEAGDVVFVQESEGGSFAFGPLGHGLVRLGFEPPGATRVVTDWFRI